MNKATAAFISAIIRNSIGIETPARSASRPYIEAITMNNAFNTLFAAITRERLWKSLRCWMSAYSGTMYMPPETPSMTMSKQTRRLEDRAMNSAGPSNKPPRASPWLKKRSIPKRVRPSAPKGTSPISTMRPERRSQRNEPAPIPTENIASSRTYTCSLPPSS